LVLRRILPEADFTIIDGDAENLGTARQFVDGRVELIHAWYAPEAVREFDLVVFPLAFRGDRGEIYRQPPAARVVVHDWMWRRRGLGVIVSWLLLKRLNLVRP
jgi:hypothetical protein